MSILNCNIRRLNSLCEKQDAKILFWKLKHGLTALVETKIKEKNLHYISMELFLDGAVLQSNLMLLVVV